MSRQPTAAAVAVALALAAAPASALEDPTRPPPGFGAGAGGGSRAPAGDQLILQSVIISPAGRSAIINGEHVLLGERFGPGRLVKVSEAEVVLLVGGSRRRLALYPGVQKHPAESMQDQDGR
jgi:hypothetical protein